MDSKEEIMARILNLSEDEFFCADQSVFAPRESRLLDVDFSGVAVNAPRQIPTARRDKLPLIMATRSSGERDWDVRLEDNLILVGTNLQDGTVHFANALLTEKELQSRGGRQKVPKGPRPPGLALAAAQLTELDARGRLHIKWNTATWALGVIYYDWCSNTVVVELKGDEPPQPSPAPSVHPPPNPNAGATEKWFFGLLRREKHIFPSYLPDSKTPKLSSSGLSFAVNTKPKGGAKLAVRGVFSTTAKARHVPESVTTHRFANGQERTVGAVVPLTLAIVGLDCQVPVRFDLAVPVYSNQKIQPGAPLRGYFAVDALSNEGRALAPGKYVAYVVMEGAIYGPVKFKWSAVGGRP